MTETNHSLTDILRSQSESRTDFLNRAEVGEKLNTIYNNMDIRSLRPNLAGLHTPTDLQNAEENFNNDRQKIVDKYHQLQHDSNITISGTINSMVLPETLETFEEDTHKFMDKHAPYEVQQAQLKVDRLIEQNPDNNQDLNTLAYSATQEADKIRAYANRERNPYYKAQLEQAASKLYTKAQEAHKKRVELAEKQQVLHAQTIQDIAKG